MPFRTSPTDTRPGAAAAEAAAGGSGAAAGSGPVVGGRDGMNTVSLSCWSGGSADILPTSNRRRGQRETRYLLAGHGDGGYIIGRPTLEAKLYQGRRGDLWRSARHRRGDFLRRDARRQPIAAEQEAVAHFSFIHNNVKFEAGLDADRTGQHVAHRMALRLVRRQLVQRAAAAEVDPAVADP